MGLNSLEGGPERRLLRKTEGTMWRWTKRKAFCAAGGKAGRSRLPEACEAQTTRVWVPGRSCKPWSLFCWSLVSLTPGTTNQNKPPVAFVSYFNRTSMVKTVTPLPSHSALLCITAPGLPSVCVRADSQGRWLHTFTFSQGLLPRTLLRTMVFCGSGISNPLLWLGSQGLITFLRVQVESREPQSPLGVSSELPNPPCPTALNSLRPRTSSQDAFPSLTSEGFRSLKQPGSRSKHLLTLKENNKIFGEIKKLMYYIWGKLGKLGLFFVFALSIAVWQLTKK